MGTRALPGFPELRRVWAGQPCLEVFSGNRLASGVAPQTAHGSVAWGRSKAFIKMTTQGTVLSSLEGQPPSRGPCRSLGLVDTVLGQIGPVWRCTASPHSWVGHSCARPLGHGADAWDWPGLSGTAPQAPFVRLYPSLRPARSATWNKPHVTPAGFVPYVTHSHAGLPVAWRLLATTITTVRDVCQRPTSESTREAPRGHPSPAAPAPSGGVAFRPTTGHLYAPPTLQ